MSLRALVVDDSAAFGRAIKQVLESIAGVEVIGLCRDGQAALDRIRAAEPDLVTLDVEMPGMNGVEVLRAMRREGLKTSVVVVSGADERARDLTVQALDLGALDMIQKPQEATPEENLAALRERLAPLVAAAAHRAEVHAIFRGGSGKREGVVRLPPPSGAPPAANGKRPEPKPAGGLPEAEPRRRGVKPALVLIGVSTGGPEALARVIPALPGDLRVPVLIVQHMPPLFTENLARKLDSASGLRVKEASEGETALAGHVYVAPGGKHLKVAAGPRNTVVLRVTGDPPENNCRPAVDVLFRSAASAFPGLSVAVILTGMGRDGTSGLRDLRAGGVLAIAQDESSCTVFGMPKEAINAGLVDIVVPIASIASEIAKAVC